MTFTWVPDFGSSKAKEYRVRVAQFGDGYEQRQASGINTKPQIWNLSFAMRENSEADEIEEFLEEHGGVASFEWTPPYSSIEGKFKCVGFTRTPEKATRSTISCTFQEVFEP